jgi:hypothetical protein
MRSAPAAFHRLRRVREVEEWSAGVGTFAHRHKSAQRTELGGIISPMRNLTRIRSEL